MPHPTDDVPTIDRCVQEFFAYQLPKKLAANTEKAYRTDIDVILRRILRDARSDETPITALDRFTMRDAFANFARDHAKASIERAHYTWRLFFDFLVQDGIVEGSPMAAVARTKLDKRRAKPFDGWDDDFAATLMNALAAGERTGREPPWPERDVAVCATLLAAGMRASEFCALRINSIEGLDGNHVIRVRGKGNKWRSIPIEAKLTEMIGGYLESRKARFPNVKQKRTDPLFLGIRSDGVTPMTVAQLRSLLLSCLAAAGLGNRRVEGTLAHAFRHTFGTTLAAQGVPVLAIANMMGHESIATTQGYLQGLARDERAGVARLPVYDTLRSMDVEES